MRVDIRPATPGDLECVVEIERAADEKFAEVGLQTVLDAPPAQVGDHAPAQAAGRLLVAVDSRSAVVGFVRIDILDGGAHLEQVSVHPQVAGCRVGAQLMCAAEEWACSYGYQRMTLCTYRDVPWNGPYYEKLGWSVLPASELSDGLRALRQHEHDLGLEVQPRQVMVKTLAGEENSASLVSSLR